MTRAKISIALRLLCILALAASFGGCKKKAEPQAAPPPEPVAPVAAAPAQPATPTPVANIAPDARLTEAQAAMKARDYEKAVDALLLVQRQRQLTEQQAALYQQQMRQLQRDLVGAIANGDPKAKAAAELLRRSASGAQ